MSPQSEILFEPVLPLYAAGFCESVGAAMSFSEFPSSTACEPE
jgi:hypothetical protein